VTAPGCPEDLLWRGRPGTTLLSPAERQRVDRHLATCADCRMSRALLEAVGPLPPLGAADAALAERLLAAWPATGNVERPPSVPIRGRARPVRFRWAAAALLLFAAGASAALYRGLPRWRVVAQVAPPPAPPPARPHRRSRAPEPRVDPPPPLEAPPPREAPPAPKAEPAVAPPRRPPPPPAPSADTLFQRANRARADGDLASASALYRELQARYPARPEARLSYVSFGQMLLGAGESRAALEQFQRYLGSGDDALAEEALVRAARACQELGEAGEEASLWRRLRSDFPRSDYRWRADDRLRALRDTGP